jgi:HK97 family phage major capsid protein
MNNLRNNAARKPAGAIERDAWIAAHKAYDLFEDAARIEKGDAAPMTSTGVHAADDIVGARMASYLRSIEPLSGAARLFGMAENFDLTGNSSVIFPMDATTLAAVPWAEEAAPIRVLKGTYDQKTLGPSRKIAAIIPISRELLKRSQGRQVFDGLMRNLFAQALDTAVFSSDGPTDTVKHEGLLYNLTAITPAGDARDDVTAILKELARLGSSGRNAIVMNPEDAASVLTRLPTLGVPTIQTRALAQGTVLGVDVGALAVSVTNLEIDVGEHAIVHMEDTTPLEIVDASTAMADPVRSFFQTATMGVRMLCDVAWVMRTDAIVTMTGVSWL